MENYILDMYLNEELSNEDILDLYEYGYISEDILEYIEEGFLKRHGLKIAAMGGANAIGYGTLGGMLAGPAGAAVGGSLGAMANGGVVRKLKDAAKLKHLKHIRKNRDKLLDKAKSEQNENVKNKIINHAKRYYKIFKNR